ncbi:hypothetical protein EDD85DRAFT_793290 [Armillaria nabsnona]|nr:hypothetical protein EDD85DRAFT_793290 [Armillaria nabsnona]
MSAFNFWFVTTKGSIDHIKPHNLEFSVVISCDTSFGVVVGTGVSSTLKDWNPDHIIDPNKWNVNLVVLKPDNALQKFYITITLSKTVAGWVGTSTDPNIPDMQMSEGLLDIVALENFTALNSSALNLADDLLNASVNRYHNCHQISRKYYPEITRDCEKSQELSAMTLTIKT